MSERTSTRAGERPSKRTLVVGALSKLGLLDRLLWLRARSGFPVLTVLTYHRIGHASDMGDFDPDVREVDAQGLSEQISVIRQAGTIVSLADVRTFFHGKRLPRNPIMIAFDDGYIDCRDVVVPLLKKERIPATFFIPTAFPDAGRLFWWDRISLLLRRCRLFRITLRYPQLLTFDLARDSTAVRRTLLRLVKRTSGLDLEQFFDDLQRATEVSVGRAEEKTLATKTILGFRDVQAIANAGFAVASHSHAHRVLTTLSPDQALVDMRKSKNLLSDVLGSDVRAIAYPVGHRLEGAFRRAVVDAGFDLGFTNATGLCVMSGADSLNVSRIAIDQDEPEALYKSRLLMG